MIDLMSAVQAATYAALDEGVPEAIAPVFDTVPEGTLGSFIQVGGIDSDNDGDKDAQRERFEVQVHSIYVGKDRGELLAMMHAAREALDEQDLQGEGVSFSPPAFLGASSDSVPAVTDDGRFVFAGVSIFEIYAEPA
jgi:hypothetical protein